MQRNEDIPKDESGVKQIRENLGKDCERGKGNEGRMKIRRKLFAPTD
jgi:hypothetical protein